MLCDLDLVPSMIQDLLPWIYLGRAHLCYVCMVPAGALNMLILFSSIYVKENGLKDHETYTCFADTCFPKSYCIHLMIMLCFMLCSWLWYAMIRYDYVMFMLYLIDMFRPLICWCLIYRFRPWIWWCLDVHVSAIVWCFDIHVSAMLWYTMILVVMPCLAMFYAMHYVYVSAMVMLDMLWLVMIILWCMICLNRMLCYATISWDYDLLMHSWLCADFWL